MTNPTSVTAGEPRYVFVTGGVVSGIGKGIAAASIGRLLVDSGLTVSIAKCDPYLNVDPGTLNPGEHGECYVTAAGDEVDLDFGHYQRFTGSHAARGASITSGAVYRHVIQAERDGAFLGETVQVIPHITDEIARRILAVGDSVDVAIVELGGTAGDIEGLPYLETLRRLRHRLGNRCVFVHVTWVPVIGVTGEMKTKPTQHSIVELRSRGIVPDVILARCENGLSPRAVEKISLLCDVVASRVIACPDVPSVYEVPAVLRDSNLLGELGDLLGLDVKVVINQDWDRAVQPVKDVPQVKVALVGKYTDATDAYLSVIEALRHAAQRVGVSADIEVLAADDSFRGEALAGYDAVVVPGGFGDRGFEAKIRAVEKCRLSDIPFLGLCLGLQAAVVDAARDSGLQGANSKEFDSACEHPVVCTMEGQAALAGTGGTMRLGEWPAVLNPSSQVAELYRATEVHERHRHRYEVNRDYDAVLRASGLQISGTSPDGELVEFVERRELGFFVATQAHPEFSSTPLRPHPLFEGLLQAGLSNRFTAEQGC